MVKGNTDSRLESIWLCKFHMGVTLVVLSTLNSAQVVVKVRLIILSFCVKGERGKLRRGYGVVYGTISK